MKGNIIVSMSLINILINIDIIRLTPRWFGKIAILSLWQA